MWVLYVGVPIYGTRGKYYIRSKKSWQRACKLTPEAVTYLCESTSKDVLIQMVRLVNS